MYTSYMCIYVYTYIYIYIYRRASASRRPAGSSPTASRCPRSKDHRENQINQRGQAKNYQRPSKIVICMIIMVRPHHDVRGANTSNDHKFGKQFINKINNYFVY